MHNKNVLGHNYNVSPQRKETYRKVITMDLNRLQGMSTNPSMKNLKTNWYFPILALIAYIWAGRQCGMGIVYTSGCVLVLLFAIMIARRIPSIFQDMKATHLGMKIWCLLSATGVSLATFYKALLYLQTHDGPRIMDNLPVNLMMIGTMMPFFFISIVYFWKAILPKLNKLQLRETTTKREKWIYGTLVVMVIAATIVAFCQTDAFYVSDKLYDIVYTSDSTMLVGGDAYTSLVHGENDIRQPLFEFFAAPFMGVPYLLGAIGGTSLSKAIAYNIPQILLLFIANFMLAKLMKLNELKRICWMLFTTVTYTSLVSVLMMEQYVFAYFYLVLCVYFMVTEKADAFLFCSATGSLLVSAAMLPVMVGEHPIKNFKKWFSKCFKYGLHLLVMIFMGCKLRVFTEMLLRPNYYDRFFHGEDTAHGALMQFTSFIRNCFIAPNAGPAPAPNYNWPSWQLDMPTTISIAGVVIFVLAIIGFIVNRKDKFAQVAMYWVGIATLVLFVLGWGVAENGQILYSLYFGWAFMALLFMLANKLEEKLNIKFLVPAVSLIATAILAYINIPAIIEMTKYLASVYPA